MKLKHTKYLKRIRKMNVTTCQNLHTTSDLETVHLPDIVSGSKADINLANKIIAALRKDGIFQIAIREEQQSATKHAFTASRQFFGLPLSVKSRFVSELTYSGYIASQQEITAGEADYSEVFTVCRDFELTDPKVKQEWPCHGPVPWPNIYYKKSMTRFMVQMGTIGDKLLLLIAIGLGFTDRYKLLNLGKSGWHHMRVLKFPSLQNKSSRGIAAHTDYGMLVIAAQDDVGGLYIRPPVAGEKRKRNWRAGESSAGMYENDPPWNFVKPVANVVTVFPGDILQFITNGYLLSTPHKVKLNTRERFALAYFHEPHFDARIYAEKNSTTNEHIHYGKHFTNMFMRSYPDRITTRRIVDKQLFNKIA